MSIEIERPLRDLESGIHPDDMRLVYLDCPQGYFPKYTSTLVLDGDTKYGKLSEHLRQREQESHTLGVDRIYPLLFPEGSFDRIISHGSLPIKIDEYLPELLRILTPGGEVRMANFLDRFSPVFKKGRHNPILASPEPNKETNPQADLINALKLVSKDKSIHGYLAYYYGDKFHMNDMVSIIFRKDEKLPEFPTDASNGYRHSSLYEIRSTFTIGNETRRPKGYNLLKID